jgi:probable phosphoglycerate mutase
MLEFLVVRPGMTEFDIRHRLKGRLDIPLCPLGVEQATAIAQQLAASGPLAALYAAPCQACRQTAELIHELCDLRPRKCAALTNLDMGLWSGLCIDDIRQRQPTIYRRWQENPETVCPPQGEMLFEARQRLQESIDRLAKKHVRGRVVLIAPEPLASILSCLLQQRSVCDLWAAENNFGTIERIAYAPLSVAAKHS